MRLEKRISITGLILLFCLPLPAIQITEIMYHPQSNEADLEYVEIHNETAARVGLTGWRISGGIDYAFPAGTILQPGAYLVVASNPTSITAVHGITNVVGPFTGRLDNNSERIRLRDPAEGIITEVEYQDDGKWPVAADGAGHSLSKYVTRGNPDDPDSWRASPLRGGTPGRQNGFEAWIDQREIIPVNATWRYFKGYTEASNPVDLWRQVSFDDSGWLTGATGIGYGDGDDTTILTDMLGNYISIFCRKTFTVPDPALVDRLILQVDHDDGFIAYLNGTDVGRDAMPTTPTIPYNASAYNHAASIEGGALTYLNIDPGLLLPTTNVLAVQVHNFGITSTDLTFIPRLTSQEIHTPGETDVPVVINEVQFNTSGTQFIELYNTSALPVDIGGAYLSNDPDNLARFQIPTATVLPGRGRAAFLQGDLGFAINASGDRVFLTTSSAQFVIDARAVETGPYDMSEGRWPDGADEWYYMALTTGTANAVSLTSAVVINEIMYHPPTGMEADEYVELYNAGATSVSLAGWRFTRGIAFDFPTTATIGPGQYRVIARDRDRLISRYTLSPNIVLGNYIGELSDTGETIRLRDANYNVADEVHYYEDGHWPKFADGYGSSLELIDPRHDNGNYQTWAPSDERSKATWQFCSYTSTVTVLSADVNEHEVHLHLMSAGEVLIDEVSLMRGAVEHVTNGSFESGSTGWTIMGNHIQSHVTTSQAHAGSRSLRLIATGRGDTGANHIETNTSAMTNYQVYTLSFWAKWQWGNRILVARCFNNQIPETYHLTVPLLTGTPGAQNSVYRANLGPVCRDVAHSPVLPAGTSTVVVTAHVYDPNGVAAVILRYRADNDASTGTATMYDDGAHSDGDAGDGLFAGQIPARAAPQTVAFYIQATDGLAQTNTWPTDQSRPALYRVETAPLSSGLPKYRIVLTQSDANLIWSRPHLSNEELNGTFLFDERDVYYNCSVRLIGSPYHRRGAGTYTNYTGYKVSFNADQKLHGLADQARVDYNPNGWYHDKLSYLLQSWMGLPNCQTEYVFVRFMERNEGAWEDTLPPGRRYLDMFYRGDDDGYLFEMDDRFWFTDDIDTVFSAAVTREEEEFRWKGWDKDPYRHNYEIRNHDNEDDHTSVVLMLRYANNINPTPPYYPPQYGTDIARMINIEQWFKLFAVRACISDWDFIAFERGKNCYMYWPEERGKWDLLGWDSELTFQLGRVNLSIWAQPTTVTRFQQYGPHLHFYYTYIQEMLDKHFTRAKLDPWIDHYNTLVAGGIPGDDKSFIDQRRAYLLGVLPVASINITTNGGLPFSVDALQVTLSGTAPVRVRWVRVGGQVYYLSWLDATTWQITLPIRPGPNNLLLEFLDYDQQLVGTDTITVTSTLALSVPRWREY